MMTEASGKGLNIQTPGKKGVKWQKSLNIRI